MAYPQESFLSTRVSPNSILGRRRDAACKNMIQYQLQTLKDTGRYDCFKLKWHPIYDREAEHWPIPDHQFWDSDIAKWIEGACYFLQSEESRAHMDIEKAIHDLVTMLRDAQQSDGYLNLHYQVVEPGKRFTNLRDMHELYNAGHLIEAALAHRQHFCNDLLFEPIVRYVNLLCDVFGPADGQIHGYPGHPEIELALLRLYKHTQDKRHLGLARFFVTERGNPTGAAEKHFYKHEADRRGELPGQRPEMYPVPYSYWYQQAHLPIVEQATIEGHSVRAMYLLTAAADLVRIDPKVPGIRDAIGTLWKNMVEKKMYATGAIGAIKQWEGFGIDYFLPQSTDEGGCYAETCAAIGVMMLAERILQYDLDGKYADMMELCLFNAVLTSMSLDGKAFTYVNQLASSEQDLSERSSWFTVCCCPPNVLRLLGQIGGYIWSHEQTKGGAATSINVHLYIPAELKIATTHDKQVTLKQEGNWPWDSKTKFTLSGDTENAQIRLRIPTWAKDWTLDPPLPDAASHLEHGYLSLPAAYLQANPSFTIDLPLQPRLIASHPRTNSNTLTLARGPIIYCVEDVDNSWVTDHFRSVHLRADCLRKARIEERMETHDGAEDYVALSIKDSAYVLDTDGLDCSAGVNERDMEAATGRRQLIPELNFVPYYFKANRGGKGMARVGLKRALV